MAVWGSRGHGTGTNLNTTKSLVTTLCEGGVESRLVEEKSLKTEVLVSLFSAYFLSFV